MTTGRINVAALTLLDIANFLYRWSPPFFILVSLVFGILILFGKNKHLKLLGLGVVLGTVISVATYIDASLPYLYDIGVLDENFFRSGNVVTVKMMLGLTVFSVSAVVTVLRWLYTRRAYGTRIGVLVTVLVLMVLGPVVRIVMNKTITNTHSASEYYESSIYLTVVNVLFSVAMTAVFLIVFFKNRKLEKAIPSYWVFLLLFILADIAAGLIAIWAVSEWNNYDPDIALFHITARILLGFISPASCIYLFRGSRKQV